MRHCNDCTGHSSRGRSIVRFSLAAAAVGGLLAAPRALPPAEGGEEPQAEVRAPDEYRSPHLLVHTDLPPDEASRLLERLEATLGVVAQYWGRPLREPIECYVVADLSNWPEASLPHPVIRVLIGGVGGATLGRTERQGAAARCDAKVYASAERGVAEHELVHAYCLHTFGATGPDWYKEGMAEMAQFRGAAGEVRCPADVIDYLHGRAPLALANVVESGEFTGAVTDSINKVVQRNAAARPGVRREPLADWTQEDSDAVQSARESYRWCWALCHTLCENPNYAERFKMLGQGYLNGQPASFGELFGGAADEVAFEYRFFVEHVEQGYRFDLCRWDWNKKFRAPRGNGASSRVEANRGFQPSGSLVEAGEEYAYAARGAWRVGSDSVPCDADGDAAGVGRLEAVVLTDFDLGEPLRLGRAGTFVAPAAGKLYLRCRDGWGQLADNTGAVTVRIKPVGE